MIKKIIKIFIMFAIVVCTYNVISNAAILATSKTVNSGETVSIVVTSNVQVSAYTVTVTGHNGLTFLTSSGGSGAGTKSISDAKATGGMSTLATFKFKAPAVEKDQIFQVSFSATGMGDVNLNPIENSTCVANVTVKANSQSANNQDSNTNLNNGSNSGTSTSTAQEKSSVATLSNLGIRPNDFSGFKANTTSYNVTVPNDVESIEVYASKGQAGQTISGTGTKRLEEGENKIEVTVTAEDGKTKKTYTINVTRKEAEEEEKPEENPEETATEEEELPEFGLKELNIKDFELNPEFKTDVYEYKLELTQDLDKLDITTLETEPNSTIEITGNKNLQDGENIITIIVTNETGDKTVAYQITVNKKVIVETVTEQNQQLDMKKIVIIAVAGIAVLAIIILIIKKVRKSREEEFDIPYSNINDVFGEINESQENLEKIPEEEEEQNYNPQDFFEQYINQMQEFEDFDEKPKRKKHSKGKRFK